MVKCGVLFEVRTEFLNNIQTNFVFKGLNEHKLLIELVHIILNFFPKQFVSDTINLV
jgi:hypothetical protein